MKIDELNLPLHNLAAEQELLGAILFKNEYLERVHDFLYPYHFAYEGHQRTYEAMCYLNTQNKEINPFSLWHYINEDDLFKNAGGLKKYLLDLAEATSIFIDSVHLGLLIKDLHMRRHLMSLCRETILSLHHGTLMDCSAEKHLEDIERKLFNLSAQDQTNTRTNHITVSIEQAMKAAELAYKGGIKALSTGFSSLDKKLGGLYPSDLIILAGRPSMGKTALATNMAMNISHNKTGVLLFSLEMSSQQIANRILSSGLSIQSNAIRRGELHDDHFAKFRKMNKDLSDVPLYVDDTPGLSCTGIRNRARRLMRQKKIGLIVIDYLQLIEPEHNRYSGNRVQEISDMTRSLKSIAKELNVPIVALSQLSRAVEQREEKRPQLADLRDSGSIEQDADIVLFVYRAEYYEERLEPDKNSPKHKDWRDRMQSLHNKAEIIIAKHRQGAIGTVSLLFDGKTTSFKDVTHG